MEAIIFFTDVDGESKADCVKADNLESLRESVEVHSEEITKSRGRVEVIDFRSYPDDRSYPEPPSDALQGKGS